jgi:hypothetical protein
MTVLRSAVVVTLMLVVYYLAPLDQSVSYLVAVEFAMGLAVLAGTIAWQIRAVLRSSTPRLRAVEAAAVAIPFLLLLYASTYELLAQAVPQSFTEPLTRTDSLYFTLTVFSTVGFGDITPRTEVARIVTMTQMIAGLVALGIVAKILLAAVQVAVQRQENDQRD